jgi:probable rRNA maturation factor
MDIIDVQYACAALPTFPDEARFAAWTKAVLTTTGADIHAPNEPLLTLRIVDEAEGAQLNRTWRGKSGPTNVLSFPFEAPEGLPPEALEPYLGDLIICAPVVAREAVAQNKTEEAHWAHLLVHGILHLLGYDHLNDADGTIMETLETRILTNLGYANPYQTPQENPHGG